MKIGQHGLQLQVYEARRTEQASNLCSPLILIRFFVAGLLPWRMYDMIVEMDVMIVLLMLAVFLSLLVNLRSSMDLHTTAFSACKASVPTA
jgi:hypothetical protein